MTVFTEGRHAGEFLMSEANGFRSRGRAVIKAGSGVFQPGTVIGAITAGKHAPSPDTEQVGIEGAEVATAVTIYGGDATTVDVEVATIERDAEINLSATTFHVSVNDAAKKKAKLAQLADLGIIAR